MPTAEKAQTVETAKEWYAKSKGLVFADYRGLKVKEMQELRRNLTAKGGELHVLKNTLFRLAVGDDLAKLPDDLHNGPTAVAFVFENESDCAKALFDYAQTHKTLIIKGGFFNGQSFDTKGVEALSKLPPRDVLIAQVIGAVAAPLTNLVSVIEALYAAPIRTIGAVADKVAKESPTPVAKVEEPAPAPVAEAEAAPAEETPAAEPSTEANAEPSAGADAQAEAAPTPEAEEAPATTPDAESETESTEPAAEAGENQE